MSSMVSSEKISNELKNATEEQRRKNREVRSTYWRDLSLPSKMLVFPLESFFIFAALLLYPSYPTLYVCITFLIVYSIANSKGLSMRQLIYFIQSLVRGKKMTRRITLFNYDLR